MTQRVFVGILTIVVFLAGYLTHGLVDRGQAIPPPPQALANELATAVNPADKAKHELERAKERAKLVADLEKYGQQIATYRGQIDEIFGEFDREFVQILNPKQREKHASNQKKRAESEAKRKANPDTAPLSDDDINRFRQQALTDVYWMVTVTPILERLTKEYELDFGQQTSVRSLLALRRTKFIALLDATPHPSIRLSKLAPMIERVAAPVQVEKK